MSSLILNEVRLDESNVLLHSLDVDLVVELNDILLLSVDSFNLHVDVLHMANVSILLCIFVNDAAKCDLDFRMNFADAEDCAHH